MAELFIELFSEEIPAKLQIDARQKIKQMIDEKLRKKEINFKSSKTFSTPKRLVFFIEGIPEKIEEKCNNKTKAIIVVHAFGQMANMQPILEIAKRKNIQIIEDAACSLNAEYKGHFAGEFGSIASFMGRPDRVGYVAAKSGVLGLTRALAVDLTRKNINVNTICPGLISTPFNKKFAEDPTHGEAWGKETIVGRWGLPTDIVGAAVFLSSDESDFINGKSITVDGGKTTD